MEKLKPSSVSKKLNKKSTMPRVVSEPKNIKIGLKNTQVKLKAAASHEAKLKSGKPKISTTKNTSQEAPKPTAPQLTKENNAEAKTDNAEPKIETVLIQPVNSKKRKKVKQANPMLEEPKNPDEAITSPSKKKKKRKGSISEVKEIPVEKLNGPNDKELTKVKATTLKPEVMFKDMASEDIGLKYSILKDKQLIEKFLKVPLNNNQKGRIRQAIKLSLEGTPKDMFPEIINGKIEAMLKSSPDLTDSELRRIRILYNMLKTSIESPNLLDQENKPPKKKDKKKKEKKKDNDLNKEDKKEGEQTVKKVKGPKRYVVFLGNLPLDVNKEKIMDHFKELNEHIKDIRLPKLAEGTKSAIAYVELGNEPSYELALSKHHSMMGNKRIRVLYTTQQNSKISRTVAKGKSAKLIALHKAGKLIGSVPATKKRSHRRAIMKAAAKAAEVAETA